jgi:hypothetical protein
MIFWLVLKLEISYYRVLISGRVLVSFRGDFLKIIFLHAKIFEFSLILLFVVRYFFFLMEMAKDHKCDTPLVYKKLGVFFGE